MFNVTHLCLQTSYRELDQFRTIVCNFYYNEDIDYNYKVTPSPYNPLLLQPSKERALVECILHPAWVDEGLLIEALKTYLFQFRDDKELYKVADFFRLDRATLDYWINEALTDEEV